MRNSCLIIAITTVATGFAAKAPLADAVQRRDASAIRVLLDQHADVNAAQADGFTALFWAARLDDAQLVDQLLHAGADTKIANQYGITPLLEACENGDAAIIESLLKAGADPNTGQAEGETPLMTAARTGDADSVRVLIDHGAQVDAKERWRGQTALMWAAAEKHAEVVQILIQRGAQVNTQSKVFDYSYIPVKNGSVPMNYPRGGFTALLFAARAGDLATGGVLVNARADLNLGDPDGATPLIEAIINGHFDFAAFLLEHGADPNAHDQRGRSPLYAAVDMHTLDTSTRPDPQTKDRLNSVDVIKMLLDHGANPNARLTKVIPPRAPLDNEDDSMGPGATPLLRAAKSDDLEVMRLLLAKGADPRITTVAHENALMAASGVGWRDGKSHGSDADAIEAIQICLDLGIGINAATTDGKTALQGAMQRGSELLVSYLITQGADISAKDNDGFNALGHQTVVAFSADVPARGTSTSGFYPSVPAVVSCADCSGAVTTYSSAPWIVIASAGDGSVKFNVLSNPGSSLRTGTIQVTHGLTRTVLTIHEEGSTAPLFPREATFLYQQILGREPDAAGVSKWITEGPAGLARMATGLLNSQDVDSQDARQTGFQVMAMYQAIRGAAPSYSTFVTALQALRNGASAESQFASVLNASGCARSRQGTVECLYQHLLGRAPTAAEAAAGTAQQPYAVFTGLLSGLPHSQALFITMLYYLVLERAPTEAEVGALMSPRSSDPEPLPILERILGTPGFTALFQ